MTIVVLSAANSPAKAIDCDAVQPLVAIHDAYRALVAQDTGQDTVAANQLLQTVPIYSAESFKIAFSDASMDLEETQLEQVFGDAAFLARDVLLGHTGQIAQHHAFNADWLTNTIARTACFDRVVAVETQAAPPKETQTESPLAHLARYKTDSQMWLPALILVLTAILGYLIYYSRHFRIKRVSRLPRVSVAFKALADIDGAQCNIIVLDISLGGSKIECDRPLNEKERVTLYLPCGTVQATIVWATAFYSGVMFDKQLTDAQLQTVLTDEGVTTRSRLSNVF